MEKEVSLPHSGSAPVGGDTAPSGRVEPTEEDYRRAEISIRIVELRSALKLAEYQKKDWDRRVEHLKTQLTEREEELRLMGEGQQLLPGVL